MTYFVDKPKGQGQNTILTRSTVKSRDKIKQIPDSPESGKTEPNADINSRSGLSSNTKDKTEEKGDDSGESVVTSSEYRLRWNLMKKRMTM